MPVSAQLILPIGTDERHRFENFIDAANPGLLPYLHSALEQRVEGERKKEVAAKGASREYQGMVLWGESGAGKSHLLSAAAHYLEQQGKAVILLKPESRISHAAQEGQGAPVYLLDDLSAFVGHDRLEQDFLTLLEAVKRQDALLIMTSRHAVKGLKISLADLFSRLQALDSFEVHALKEPQKRELIRQRAYQKGIILNDDVLNWLFTHTSRDLRVLLDLLEQIDSHSLSQQRRVTIPLLKAMLSD